jgi:hypothetical protein
MAAWPLRVRTSTISAQAGPWRREAATAIRHHVLPVQSRAASKITKAPGMTRANANWKNGVKCMRANPDVVEGSEAVTKKAPS